MQVSPRLARISVGRTAALIAVLLAGDFELRHVQAQHDPAPPKVVSAQEFRLLDKDGKTRASLTMQAEGSPGLALFDKEGKLRALLRVRSDGSSALSLHDADGKNRAALDTQASGSVSLTLTNKNGKGGAGLVVLPDGTSAAVLNDKDGKVVWAEPAKPDDQ